MFYNNGRHFIYVIFLIISYSIVPRPFFLSFSIDKHREEVISLGYMFIGKSKSEMCLYVCLIDIIQTLCMPTEGNILKHFI